jgi:broad specificity phosphatase PhoE
MSGSATVSISVRDPDVPLSDLGRRQAGAIGKLWKGSDPADRPDLVFSSPYERALATARIAIDESGLALDVRPDERLRERDLGLFDGLTALGIRERYPEEAQRRANLGKFYYRPPHGESWVDVALRVRSVLSELWSDHPSAAVAVFSHQAVLFVTRYVIEGLTESEILEIDRHTRFHNGGITSYAADEGKPMRLVDHDAIDHLEETETPATAGHDAHVDV